MATILLTGATGALGSALLPLLVRKHKVIALARPKGAQSAYERLAKVQGGRLPQGVAVVKGDILEPRCGISSLELELHRGNVDMVLHCAASISFDPKDADLTQATNVEGVKNALELAEVLGVSDFFQVSTAYVSGDADHYGEDDHYVSQRWRNPYEETKHTGEAMVRSWARSLPESARHAEIVRPSIVVGSSKDGWTPTYDAFYGYFRILDAFAERFREPGRHMPKGISVDVNGIVTLPLTLRANSLATLNLVTVDWVAETIAALVDAPHRDRCQVYHLTNDDPPLVRYVIEESLRHLGIRGVRVIEPDERLPILSGQESSRVIETLQSRVDAVLKRFDPYVSHGPEFAMHETRRALRTRFRPAPRVDSECLKKLLGYAKRHAWGAIPAEVDRERVP